MPLILPHTPSRPDRSTPWRHRPLSQRLTAPLTFGRDQEPTPHVRIGRRLFQETGSRTTPLAPPRPLEEVRWDGGAPESVAGVEILRSRRIGLRLTGLELTDLRLVDGLSLHGSTVDRLKGGASLRGTTIGSDQLVPLALPVLAAQGIQVDDDPPDLVDGG